MTQHPVCDYCGQRHPAWPEDSLMTEEEFYAGLEQMSGREREELRQNVLTMDAPGGLMDQELGTERVCHFCGVMFRPLGVVKGPEGNRRWVKGRDDARFCTEAHRKAAHRARKG
jgi:hypothetical protein